MAGIIRYMITGALIGAGLGGATKTIVALTQRSTRDISMNLDDDVFGNDLMDEAMPTLPPAEEYQSDKEHYQQRDN